MKEYEIKITGSGTKVEIINALNDLILSISETNDLDDKTFEDETLCTETSKIDQ